MHFLCGGAGAIFSIEAKHAGFALGVVILSTALWGIAWSNDSYYSNT